MSRLTVIHGDCLLKLRDLETELGSAEYEDCPGCPKCAPNDGLVLRRGNWRCTTAHEYVFQFSKSKDYFCDAEAAKEPAARGHAGSRFDKGKTAVNGNGRVQSGNRVETGTRNRRSVWTINTKGFPGAHFATFPAKLIEPIIRCATPPKACGKCGAPYAPVVERGEPDLDHQRACGGDANGHYQSNGLKDYASAGVQNPSSVKARILAGMVSKTVASYRATCGCGAEAVPSVVLDPFGGSGTVGMVANNLGRSAVLIEIAEHYLPLIAERTGTTDGHLNLNT